MSGTEIGDAPSRKPKCDCWSAPQARYRHTPSYAMSGTDLAYGGDTTFIRFPAGTEIARCAVLSLAMVLRSRYAVCGTELGYGATRCAVLSWCMASCDV
eukprot:2466812-Rhodomonas_salina.1